MAIDTAEKRRSAAGFSSWWIAPGVTPNASKDQEWRQQALWSYSGISASTVTIINGPYCVAAGQVFQAGSVTGEVFQAGPVIGEVSC